MYTVTRNRLERCIDLSADWKEPYNKNFIEIACSVHIGLIDSTGGVLVCATNSLLYLNQSVPPYGVSLNSIADHSTDFPLSKNQLLNTSDHNLLQTVYF